MKKLFFIGGASIGLLAFPVLATAVNVATFEGNVYIEGEIQTGPELRA